MSRTLTEKQVLKKLKISDFRQLSKENVMKFVTMLPNVDTEVAKKALEQFPNFAKTTREILLDYKEILQKGMDSNDKSIAKCYEAGNTIIHSLQQMLESEALSFDERKYIVEKMLEVSKMMNEKDMENKKFIAFLALVGCSAVTISFRSLAAAVGSNSNVE